VRIVVTGATGFIGARLVTQLAGAHEVFAVTRDTSPEEAQVQWITHDLRAPLPATFPDRVDAVVHLAQSRYYREFPERADDIFGLNVGATFRLLEYARRAEASRFVFTSTGGIYGQSDERFIESDPANPINFYLATKYAAETLIASYELSFKTIVLRPFFVYGPRQRGMLISRLAERVLSREQITIDGNPGIRINPIYVDDAVAVLERALTYDGSLLCNLAGREEASLTDIVRLLGELAGEQPSISYEAAGQTGDIVGDTRLLEQTFGFDPQVPLREGLRRVIEEQAASAV
jgi:nucleoside-diphosphate-sugar epimerase